MYIDVQLLLTFLNFCILLGIISYWFKNTFVILDKKTWDKIIEAIEQNQIENVEQVEELPGGTGFFREYLEDVEEYEDE